MSKVKKIADGKNAVAETAQAQLVSSQQEERLVEATELLTAVRLTQSIGRTFSAQSFHALELFAKRKGFEAYGYTRFDDFLDNYPRSPMTRDQFYERRDALRREGDDAFDTLNALRIPISARKLLGDGTITVSGDTLIIGEEQVTVTDRERVKEVIRTLADKAAEQSRTIERGKKDNERLKRKLDDAQRSAVSKILDDSDPHDKALTVALIALGGVKAEAAKLSLDEAIKARDNAMRMLTTVLADVREAYRFGDDPTTGGFMSDKLSDRDVDEMFD